MNPEKIVKFSISYIYKRGQLCYTNSRVLAIYLALGISPVPDGHVGILPTLR